MRAGELAFLDTNILVYATERDNPLHGKAVEIVDRINSGEVEACISPQVMGELYSTITNPKKIRKPCPPAEAVEIVRILWEARGVRKIYPKEETLQLTLDLVRLPN